MDITLTFVNQSTDDNNSQIVIFEGPPAPDENVDSVQAPLLVHRVFALPPAGAGVSIDHSGSSIALGVAPAAAAGEVLPSPPQAPPVLLALPASSSATILVKGGGTVPVFFVVSAGDAVDAPAVHAGEAAGGLLGSLVSAVRRIWRMITGGR